jgi:hypothetical protein
VLRILDLNMQNSLAAIDPQFGATAALLSLVNCGLMALQHLLMSIKHGQLNAPLSAGEYLSWSGH